MKYKSELIKDIVDTRGHKKSSLQYESECIEQWIAENEGAYPKLTDYQAEWLNYINENPVGDFPYETVTANPTATINNVVPYAYQSAILKGNSIKNYKNNLFDNVLEYGTISISTGEPNQTNSRAYRSVNFIPINGKFKIAKYGIDGDLHVCFYDSNKSFISNKTYVLRDVTEGNATVTPPTNSSFFKFYNTYDDNEPTGEFGFGVMAENEMIELEIQSVKMPVLTTTGKNLWDNKIFENCPIATINNDGSLTLNGTLNQHWMFKYTIDKGTYITSAIGNDNGYIHMFWDGGDGYFQTQKPFDISEQMTRDGYIPVGKYDNINIKLQLEQSSTNTPYEPYQSNILTVNEDVTLRGIGDGKDTMDCLTGEVVERIKERVFNGSEKWVQNGQHTDGSYRHMCNMYSDAKSSSNYVICDKIGFADVNTSTGSGMTSDINIIKTTSKGKIQIATTKSIIEFKEWLEQNPITIQYELATETVKTVDLTVVNQDNETLDKIKPHEGTMNINVTGNPINPIGVFEIPVEAITQNLASFIDLETEE